MHINVKKIDLPKIPADRIPVPLSASSSSSSEKSGIEGDK